MKTYFQILIYFIGFYLITANASAEKMDSFQIYSSTSPSDKVKIKYPLWFKSSFFDLSEDLADAHQTGKRGIILFFSQENCNHCRAYIEATFKDPAVKTRINTNYDVIGLEIFSDIEVTDIDGSVLTIKEFAEKQRAFLTPTLLFYDIHNPHPLRLMGFYPPEKFHHVLDYIAGGHYSTMRLNQYLRNKQANTTVKKNSRLVADTLFSKPPHNLANKQTKEKRPMLVLFESPNCKPCKRFHDRVLTDPKVRKKMSKFLAIQLDSSDNSRKLTTPDGRKLTPFQWADELQLNYDISVVFFNEQGKEVLRNDAETGKQRMEFTMEYVLTKGYQDEKQVNRWRRQQILKQNSRIN